MDGISMFRSRRQEEAAVAEMRSWTGRSKMSGVNLSRLSRTATRSSTWSPHSANVRPRRISACSATPFISSRSSGSFPATERATCWASWVSLRVRRRAPCQGLVVEARLKLPSSAARRSRPASSSRSRMLSSTLRLSRTVVAGAGWMDVSSASDCMAS